ncbi:MAG: hypothetical protein M1832_006455 [Thelocarpon impressellum]|nr:MAG: hypothetical protein M1832_006455 [Thelocarpon impressellum]
MKLFALLPLLTSLAMMPVEAAPKGCAGCFTTQGGCRSSDSKGATLTKEHMASLRILWMESFHTDGSGSLPSIKFPKATEWHQAVCCKDWCFEMRNGGGKNSKWTKKDFDDSYERILGDMKKTQAPDECDTSVEKNRHKNLWLSVVRSDSQVTYDDTMKEVIGETCAGKPGYRGEF